MRSSDHESGHSRRQLLRHHRGRSATLPEEVLSDASGLWHRSARFLKGLFDSLRIMINHREIGPCDAVRLGSSLLPLLQRSGAEAVPGGELVLREAAPLAYGSHINRSRDGVRGGPKLDLAAMMG